MEMDEKETRAKIEAAIMAQMGFMPWDEYANQNRIKFNGRNTGATTHNLVQALIGAIRGEHVVITGCAIEMMRDQFCRIGQTCRIDLRSLKVTFVDTRGLALKRPLNMSEQDHARATYYRDHWQV